MGTTTSVLICLALGTIALACMICNLFAYGKQIHANYSLQKTTEDDAVNLPD